MQRGLGVRPVRPAAPWAPPVRRVAADGDLERLLSSRAPLASGAHARVSGRAQGEQDPEMGRAAGDSSEGRRPVLPLGGRLVRSEALGAGKPGVGAGPPRPPSCPSELGVRELASGAPVLATRPTPVAST